jgi:hypothetical protein
VKTAGFAIVLGAVTLAVPVVSDGRSATTYETLRVKVLTPKVSNVRGVATSKVGTLFIADPTQPVVFKFSVANVGSAPLSNVHIRFFPGEADPRPVVLKTVPQARLVRAHAGGYALWTIKSLGGRQSRIYSATATFRKVAAGSDWKAGMSAAATRTGINGALTAEFTMAVRLRAG